MLTKTRKNNLQLKLAAFVIDEPSIWAKENQWLTRTNKDGSSELRPHVSFAISCAVAGLKALPRPERQRILLNGARHIIAEEDRVDISGRQRVRLERSERVRPAGASRASLS